jgi:hypothetical protein
MDTVRSEAVYLRHRVRESLAMAEAAASPCARLAHEMLARLYGEAIDALSARPILHIVPSMAKALPRTVGMQVSQSLATSVESAPLQRCVSATLVS